MKLKELSVLVVAMAFSANCSSSSSGSGGKGGSAGTGGTAGSAGGFAGGFAGSTAGTGGAGAVGGGTVDASVDAQSGSDGPTIPAACMGRNLTGPHTIIFDFDTPGDIQGWGWEERDQTAPVLPLAQSTLQAHDGPGSLEATITVHGYPDSGAPSVDGGLNYVAPNGQFFLGQATGAPKIVLKRGDVIEFWVYAPDATKGDPYVAVFAAAGASYWSGPNVFLATEDANKPGWRRYEMDTCHIDSACPNVIGSYGCNDSFSSNDSGGQVAVLFSSSDPLDGVKVYVDSVGYVYKAP